MFAAAPVGRGRDNFLHYLWLQVIQHITARIDELQEEMAELKECQQLDRERRAYEFLLAEARLKRSQVAVRCRDVAVPRSPLAVSGGVPHFVTGAVDSWTASTDSKQKCQSTGMRSVLRTPPSNKK